MSDSILRGGSAGFWGVTFMSDQYSVESVWRFTNNDCKLDIYWRKFEPSMARRWFDKLRKIPFLRGPAIMIDMLWQGMRDSKMAIALMLFMVFGPSLIDFIVTGFNLKGSITPPEFLKEWGDYLFYAGIALMFGGLWMANKELFRFHSAEHMVLNCIMANDGNIVPENLTKYSRLTMNCGSIFYIIELTIYIPMVIGLFPEKLTSPLLAMLLAFGFLIIATSLAYEIFRHDKAALLFKPLGYLVQYLIFTRKPREFHLLAAAAAAYALYRLENNQSICDNPPNYLGKVIQRP